VNFWGGESLLLWPKKEKREKIWEKKDFDT
jgi:hypothetical protein